MLAPPERPLPDPKKFDEWVAMYQSRLSSVTGIAMDTLCPDYEDLGGEAEGEAHYRAQDDALWKVFATGVDAVDAADEEAKRWRIPLLPGEPQRPPVETPEEFRREWKAQKDRWGDDFYSW